MTRPAPEVAHNAAGPDENESGNLAYAARRRKELERSPVQNTGRTPTQFPHSSRKCPPTPGGAPPAPPTSVAVHGVASVRAQAPVHAAGVEEGSPAPSAPAAPDARSRSGPSRSRPPRPAGVA